MRWENDLGKISLDELKSFHFLEQLAAHLCRASRDNNAGFLECVDLVLCTALST